VRAPKLILLIFGVLLTLAGVALVACGGLIVGVYRSYSDADGFFTSPSQTIGSEGFALTVPDINGQLVSEWQRWGLSRAQATLRVTGSSKLPAPIFIGVAPTGRATDYLSGVARDRITSIDLRSGSVDYDHVDGNALPASPEEQGFWVAKATGTGSQTLEWTLGEGDWAVVIMNGDASAPVAAELSLGARFGIMHRLIVGLFSGGAALVAIGILLLFFRSRRRRMAPGIRPRAT
jgi:hypothetical protein